MKKILLCLVLMAAALPLVAQEAKNALDFSAEEKKRTTDMGDYRFSVTCRIEAGYVQDWQNSRSGSYPDTYLHGAKLGASFDFNLPYSMSVQTGLFYALTAGKNTQYYAPVTTGVTADQYLEHHIMQHSLLIPVRFTYTQKLWRDLALYFYTGPEFSIGLAQQDNIEVSMAQTTLDWLNNIGQPTASYDKYREKELRRFNCQYGLGGGIQWAAYRLQSGYAYGLNNLVKQQGTPATPQGIHTDSHMWQWGWYVSFSYAF